ncbi:MAG: aminotransferase [Rhodospirillales bacterium]|nr:aminotransferase [Rhodospirillales bacterium]
MSAGEEPAPGGIAYRINPALGAVIPPPIAAIARLAADREFPPDKPPLDLAQAVPAYPPADALTAHLASAVRKPEMARYTPIVGRDDLRGALATALSQAYGGRVAPAQVAITAGCNQAFCLALMALAGSGDEAILAGPSYFNYQMWLEMLGVSPVYLPFRPERGGVPDPADARERITPRTRAIVLVTPNNPTGAIYPPETIDGFHRLAREAGVALVLDETYRDFLPGSGPPHGLFAEPRWDETLVHLYSFSKVYSLTGYRVGALVAGRGLLAEVAKAADCVAICAPAIAQEAALYGLNHLADFRADKRRLVLERVAQFRAVFERRDLSYELICAGAFFAYVRHPFAGTPAVDVAHRLIRDENVLCLPGSAFGPDQEDYLRFALANIDGDAMTALGERLVASQG